MCTVFTGIEPQCYLLAKNYDCLVKGGMAFTNKRKVKRKSLVLPPEKELEWVSQFGSVTFSQSGKGMPVCGINEKGLIVEQATFPAALYPDTTEKKHISCLEAIQYLLDCCADVEQAIQAFSDFAISNQSAKIHYFLMDKKGNRAIVEFANGDTKVFQGKTMLPILTNSSYEALCLGKKQNTSEYEENSFMRFQIVKEALEKENSLTVDSAFAILEKAERKDTVWSVVYDLIANKIYFRDEKRRIKAIHLEEIDFSENATSKLYDLEDDSDEILWEPYSRQKNRKNIEKFYGNPLVLQVLNLPDAKFVIDSFDEHISRIEEGKL